MELKSLLETTRVGRLPVKLTEVIVCNITRNLPMLRIKVSTPKLLPTSCYLLT